MAVTNERKVIIGTCANDKCSVNQGLLFIQDTYVLVNVKGGYAMYHPECAPEESSG